MKEWMRILRQDKRLRTVRLGLGLLFVFAVFGDFIANEKPLYCKVDGQRYFPVFRAVPVTLGVAQWPPAISDQRWRTREYQSVVYTLIPYSPHTLDSRNGSYKGPFDKQDVDHVRFRHWLGTDSVGRDVTAGMIRGCRIALLVGVLSMLIALLIGVPMGAYAGYFGDRESRTSWPGLILLIPLTIAAGWYMVECFSYLRDGHTSQALLQLIPVVAIFLIWRLHERFAPGIYPNSWMRGFPWDSLTMRVVEILRSIPGLFLLLGLLAIVAKPSLTILIAVIGVLRAPTIVRYVRAEAMRLRTRSFVDAARVAGLSDQQIIRRHIVPNALGPVLISVAFGIAGAVLLESALSFLGIGLNIDQMSWGRLLSSARSNFSAWWLAVLPGFAIFITIALFNRLGERISRTLEGNDLP